VKSKKSQTNQTKENPKENLIATLRAILANQSLQVEFLDDVKNNFFGWDQNLIIEEKAILPQISNEESLRTNDSRASADLAASYLLFHNFEINQQKTRNLEEQKFFNDFEKIRVIAKMRASYLGVVKNILEKVESDIFSGSTNLSLILLREIFDEKILPQTQNAAQDLQRSLNKKIVAEIKNLARKIENQNEFESGVEKVLEMLRNDQNSEEEKENEEKSDAKNDNKKNELNSFGQENIEAENENNSAQNDIEEGVKQIEEEQKISDLKSDDQKGNVSVKLDAPTDFENKIEYKNAYKIYNSKFDEIIFPNKLINKNELQLLRDQLDLKLAKLKTISRKMSLKLKRKLLSKRNSYLEFDASRGILDRKKLVRMVIDPMMEDVWISNKTHEYQDTALTILIDNSGSMRGNPIVMSALACEIIAEILEKYSVKTEIIGFTTADWKGGRPRKLWESSGRAQNPGRLNELRHIIYKHFNQKFKKSRINLGLMLKEGLLKENIDGEALLFARARLMQQSEKRKILMVISDGTPVDDSTASANDGDILAEHLRHVINKIEKQTQIEIVGVGIGHTTEEFYRNSITIRSLEELGDVMIEKITDLL
jgi:cobaltochelatase CobT